MIEKFLVIFAKVGLKVLVLTGSGLYHLLRQSVSILLLLAAVFTMGSVASGGGMPLRIIGLITSAFTLNK